MVAAVVASQPAATGVEIPIRLAVEGAAFALQLVIVAVKTTQLMVVLQNNLFRFFFIKKKHKKTNKSKKRTEKKYFKKVSKIGLVKEIELK